VKGTGVGRVVRWNRKARVNYVHCRTGTGNLQAWRHVLDSHVSDQCEVCRNSEAHSPGLHTWRGYWAVVGDVGVNG